MRKVKCKKGRPRTNLKKIGNQIKSLMSKDPSIKWSHQALAKMCGVSRPIISSTLKKYGIILKHNHAKHFSRSERGKIVFSSPQKKQLDELLIKHQDDPEITLRLQIIQLADQGYKNNQITKQLNVGINTVKKYKNIFRKMGFEGILAEPSKGRPRSKVKTQSTLLEHSKKVRSEVLNDVSQRLAKPIIIHGRNGKVYTFFEDPFSWKMQLCQFAERYCTQIVFHDFLLDNVAHRKKTIPKHESEIWFQSTPRNPLPQHKERRALVKITLPSGTQYWVYKNPRQFSVFLKKKTIREIASLFEEIFIISASSQPNVSQIIDANDQKDFFPIFCPSREKFRGETDYRFMDELIEDLKNNFQKDHTICCKNQPHCLLKDGTHIENEECKFCFHHTCGILLVQKYGYGWKSFLQEERAWIWCKFIGNKMPHPLAEEKINFDIEKILDDLFRFMSESQLK